MRQLNRISTIFFFSVIILISLLGTGCGNGSTVVSSETSIQESKSSISNVSQPEVPLRELSYEEYFTKEREWIDETCANASGYFYDIINGNVTRFRFQPATNKEINLMHICKNIGFVNDHTVVYGNPIFIVDGYKLIQTDENGQNQKLIYEDSRLNNEFIKIIFVTRELIYFLRGEHTICRLHRQSGIVDEIVNTEKDISSFRPLSNYAVLWSVFTPEWIEFEKTGQSWEDAPYGIKQKVNFITNFQTGATRELTDSDYDSYGFLKYKIQE